MIISKEWMERVKKAKQEQQETYVLPSNASANSNRAG